MQLAEYATMFQLEQGHWWYRGLRAMLDLHWRRHVRAAQPRLIDCGCGTGGNLFALAPRCGDVAGFDRSPEAVRFCLERGQRRLAVADAVEIPFAADTFDVAISCDVLYHGGVRDPEEALREILRVLRPGGIVMLNLPAYEWLRSSHDAAINTARRFTRGQVRGMLARAGFELVEDTYWNSLLFPAMAAVRLLRKGVETEGSDVASSMHGPTTVVANVALQLEQRLLRVMRFPFGLSIFTVGRKPG